MDNATVLCVEHLCTSFFTQNGEVKAVNDVSISVPRGRIVGIVGESGCGKSMTARSIMRLLHYPGRIVSGSIPRASAACSCVSFASILDFLILLPISTLLPPNICIIPYVKSTVYQSAFTSRNFSVKMLLHFSVFPETL